MGHSYSYAQSGLPCSGEEQIEVIEKINSPFLKATIDVGNYMQCGQSGDEDETTGVPASVEFMKSVMKDY